MSMEKYINDFIKWGKSNILSHLKPNFKNEASKNERMLFIIITHYAKFAAWICVLCVRQELKAICHVWLTQNIISRTPIDGSALINIATYQDSILMYSLGTHPRSPDCSTFPLLLALVCIFSQSFDCDKNSPIPWLQEGRQESSIRDNHQHNVSGRPWLLLIVLPTAAAYVCVISEHWLFCPVWHLGNSYASFRKQTKKKSKEHPISYFPPILVCLLLVN